MRHILIAGHSRISEGIASAVELIIGEKLNILMHIFQENHFCRKNHGRNKKYSCDDEVIIVTDILGAV